MSKIPGTNLEFVGYWDKCFFRHSEDSSGVIVEENGKQKEITYRELKKILKEE